MLKFIKHHMETIMGIEIFPMISLLIFFIFFTVLILWVYRSDKGYNARMAQLPLEEEDDAQLFN
ncbi:CcoQ/FixQ family Cbb3-type cytochrome c oxidase assembly chaperone [Nafulsella turpanensis]|uniref:CcoQ/FixQ family Cbb3-type cytochrome c oxidase assembly chaperone n=1 Tax=Nafulsella turpanensis TaxID=1265690 RepID=UPI0009D97898|nr:CcoQ/FixQ family Cbb3-type cytochrome c oxidase assembly chaperone [Nafulsella turpanensis]